MSDLIETKTRMSDDLKDAYFLFANANWAAGEFQ